MGQSAGTHEVGDVPAKLRPFVRLIGLDRTVDLLLALGGAEVYLPSYGRKANS